MQNQILVPFATALLSQVVSALNMNSDKLAAAISFSEIDIEYLHEDALEFAQLQTIDTLDIKEAECRDKVFVKRARKIAACEKRYGDDPVRERVCLRNTVEKWFNNNIHKCEPCEDKIEVKYQKKKGNCDKFGHKPKAQEKCYSNALNWREKMVGKCPAQPPTCREKAQTKLTERLTMCEPLEDEYEKNLCLMGADLFFKIDEGYCSF